MNSYKCKISRIIDADTFVGIVDLGFDASLKITIRLYGCDAWEMHGSEKSDGIKARDYIESLIGGQTVDICHYKKDSFGRWLCDVCYKDRSVAKLLAEHDCLKKV